VFSFFSKKKKSQDTLQPKMIEDYSNAQPLAEYFESETGINFNKQPSVFKSKLIVFCKLHDIASFDLCFEQVLQTPEFRQAFINHFTTNESYFFREHAQIEDMVKQATECAAHINILSIPCSTGEEPYSIAIELLEAGMSTQKFTIVGVDIDTTALVRAEAGHYSKRSVSRVPVEIVDKYFTQQEQLFRICDEARRSVVWRNLNIFEPDFLTLGTFDYIFSRNMLIYFDMETKQKAQLVLASLLKDPGQNVYYGHADLY
tara:strand:- start:4907 stop:5683 length:777 start_codon:yes stop_codon:yes gene_type:complete